MKQPGGAIALHAPDAVFSIRHVPTWLLLAFSAGAVNALAYLACARFVTHVTGTVSSIGMDASSVFLAFDYAVVLACFVAGAMASAALIEGRHYRGRRPLYAVPLLVAAVILVGAGVAGGLGAFGAFGTSCEGPRDFALLSALAFAMGLQNASAATSTGNVVRTTHMTGPATDLGVHLATAFYAAGDTRKSSIRHAALRAAKITAFTIGAGAGVVLSKAFQYHGLVVVAGLLVVTACLSFVRFPAGWRLPGLVKDKREAEIVAG